MSSANAVELALVPETKYGTTPDLATAQGALIRFTVESLSGTPQTTTSAENRTDRMSGGQVVTGLEVGGSITGELSPDEVYQRLFQMGMMDATPTASPPPLALDAGSFTKDAVNDQLAVLEVAIGDLNADYAPGQMIMLSGFAEAANNGPSQIVSIDPAGLSMQVTTRREAVTVDPILAGAEAVLPAYVEIGSDIISATFSKAYTDTLHLASTDQHSQRYSGGIVNGFKVDLAYGALAAVTYTILANGYIQEHPSLVQKIEAAGGTVADAGTANILNASIDMGMVTIGGLPTEFCIETLSITLDNGNTPQNCLGKPAPTKYNPGTANISIEASIYLADPAYDTFMPAKLTQEPIGMLFVVSNQDGGYAFEVTAAQLSFPDPNVTGQNAPVMIDAAGVGKVGPDGSSALRIYYW